MNKTVSVIVDNLKQVLAVIVSTIVIVGAMGGYMSTFANADDFQALQELHHRDIARIEVKIDDNEKERKKDKIIESIGAYTDKMHELQIKPNKTQYELDILSYYRDKKDDLKTKLDSEY